MDEHLQKKSQFVLVSREDGEQKKLSVIHNLVSECHKPNLREKKKGEGECGGINPYTLMGRHGLLIRGGSAHKMKM